MSRSCQRYSTSLSTSFPGINVIATASRSESVEWCKKMGADMIEQHHLLNTVANLIDNKRIKTTTTDLFTPINAENLVRHTPGT